MTRLVWTELRVTGGEEIGRRYTLRPGQTFVIGRSRKVAIALREDDLVSRQHAAIELGTEGLIVTDLGSRNGTFLGGVRLAPNRPTYMKQDEVLAVGSHSFRMEVHAPDDADDDIVETLSFKSIPPLPSSEYKILGLIGGGTNGRVFAADQLLMRRRVAIKVLDSRSAGSAEERERILRDGRIGSQIHSPNIVDVYDVRVVAGQVCLVMELVQGPSALDLLQNGPLPVRDVLKIGEDLAAALQAAKDFGVVHRDIKPSKILIDPRGLAKLTDFGMAKSLSVKEGSAVLRKSRVGTPDYSSPEQVRSWDSADVRSDIYSLAATLYHLMRGEPWDLYASESPSGPAIPAEVEALLKAMLRVDPEERPYPPKILAKRFHDLRVRLFPDSVRLKTFETGEHRIFDPDEDEG